VTSRNGLRVGGGIDLNQVDLPDPLAGTLEHLLDRIDLLEAEVERLKRASETSGAGHRG